MSWEKVKLGDICEINIGKTPSRNISSYWGGNNKWISISDLKGKRYIEDTKENITEIAVKESGIKAIPPNTLLYSFKLSIGKLAITKDYIYSNEAIASLPILDKTKVSLDYLYWAMQTLQLDSVGDKAVMGITLNKAKLKNLEIPLPPLSVQEKIAAILDNADALRRKDQELQKKYDELAQAIFIDMFGDPVKNEKGWEVKRLEELGKLDRGVSKHRPRNAPELIGGPYPLIQTGDVANSGGWIKYYRSTYSEIGLKQSKIWKEGTLCITIAANIAKTGILTFDACFPDSIVGFSSNEHSNEIFIQYWFSFFQKLLEDQAPESAQKNINLGILRDLKVISPPLSLQEAFTKKIELIKQLKAQANAEKSEELFQSLLQRAFKDELITEVDNL